MSKLQRYAEALAVAERTVQNEKLKAVLREARGKIESGHLTWRNGMAGRDEYKPVDDAAKNPQASSS
ncbi:MAG: hypothetical protein AAF958_01410 [Planctomycetota bacterium]